MLKHEHYVNKTKWDKVKEQLKGIGSAILIALLIRIFLIEPYQIPTPSMYPTILEGDMIMANKFWYGVRVPVANLKLPSFSSPKPGNIILFETPTYKSPGKWKEFLNFITFGIFGLDNNADSSAKYFIKRAVAGPGDILRIYDPRDTQFKYQLELNGKKVLLTPVDFPLNFSGKNSFSFYAEKIQDTLHYVQYYKHEGKNPSLSFPKDLPGSLYVPKEDDEITFILEQRHDNLAAVKEAKEAGTDPDIHISDIVKLKVASKNKEQKEIRTTGRIIRAIYYTYPNSEKGVNSILSKNDLYQLILEGQVTKKVKEDFYFAMGDNRDNSSDSRFWGLVNHSLLLGTPMFRHFPFTRFGGVDSTPKLEQKEKSDEK